MPELLDDIDDSDDSDDGDDTAGFLAAWYGPPDRCAEPEPPGAARLPAALREWYATTSRYARPVLFNHKVSPLDRLYEGDDGPLAFCADDFEWQEFGVVLGTADPVVHRLLTDMAPRPSSDPGGDAGWEPHEEGMRLSQFLRALLRHETVLGAGYGAEADGLAPDQCERLLAPLCRLPGPELFTAQYAGAGLLAIAWPAGGEGDTWDVRLAARDEELLGYAEAVPGVRFGRGEWCPVEERP